MARWLLLRRLLGISWIATSFVGIAVYTLTKYRDAVKHDQMRLHFESRLHKLQNDLKRVCLFVHVRNFLALVLGTFLC